jgi:hypothetical protein
MNDNHIGPTDPRVAVHAVAIIVREKDHTLEIRQFRQHLKRGGPDIAVIFRALVAPRIVTHAEERHEQTNERKRIPARLVSDARPQQPRRPCATHHHSSHLLPLFQRPAGTALYCKLTG